MVAEPLEPAESPFGVEYTQPAPGLKPLYLLADSQLLFWKEEGVPFMRTVRERLGKSSPLVAYVGASNGDDPAFYSLFEAAMEEAGIRERRRILSELGPEDLDTIDHADLVLLAGGDVERGWRTFERNGLKQILVRRYYEGLLLMGVSAGAVQLGLGGWGEGGVAGGRFVDTFRLIPHVIGAHEEEEDWAPLKAAVLKMGEHVRGYGVPMGGGLVYYPDHSLQPLKRPAVEIRVKRNNLRQTLLVPGENPEEEEDEGPAVN
jgi:hypothetical protein